MSFFPLQKLKATQPTKTPVVRVAHLEEEGSNEEAGTGSEDPDGIDGVTEEFIMCLVRAVRFSGNISEGQLGISRDGYPSPISEKPLWWCYTVQDGIIRERHIWFRHPPQFKDAPWQEAWLTWHQWNGPLCPIL